jgi:pseudaminic acid synthase
MVKPIKIHNTLVGPGSPAFIVAELSGNHDGSLERALDIVRAAKRAGANAIKLQTYTADSITLKSNKEDFLLPSASPWAQHKTFWELYDVAKTPLEWHKPIFDEANKLGLIAFSSPFDHEAVEFLESLYVPVYKIASPEIVDIPLLEKVARTGKPVIISKGVAEYEDIILALETLRKHGAKDIALLQCNSAYPSPLKDSNLQTIQDIPKKFGVLSGLSDHTEGDMAALIAVALGANIIEKHLTLSSDDSAVDSFFSLTEEGFTSMVSNIRKAEVIIGNVSYELTESARVSISGRRSLYVVKNIKFGELVTSDNVKSIRPAYGMHPKHFSEILGKKVNRDIEAGERFTWDLLQ